MKKPNQDKDFYLIAKKIHNQSSSPGKHDSKHSPSQFDKQSQEALKMIEAYRKVENLKPASSNKPQRNSEQLKQTTLSQQPKSTYANKIKQTLRQLNANKAKEYEKLSQKNIELKSEPKSLQIINEQGFKAKSQQQKRLVSKAVQKIYLTIGVLLKKNKKSSFQLIFAQSQSILENDCAMAKKYRLFRLFSLWKEEAKALKISNQRKRKQQQQKELGAMELANEFRMFSVYKKVLKHWSKVAKMQKKKRKYEKELKQIQSQRNTVNKNQLLSAGHQKRIQSHVNADPLQNKLKGFLSGLKQKIEFKDKAPLHPITQHSEQSQRASNVFTQQGKHQEPSNEEINQLEQENQNQNEQIQQNQGPKQPLSNQALQKNRQEIYERSKQRKQALEKLKKQKELIKKIQQEERKQLEKQIQEENKKIKELKYKEFQQRKKLEKEWEEREKELSVKADEWNRLRIVKFYGFDHWKSLKNQNLAKAQALKNTVKRIMLKHAGSQLFENLNANMEYVLEFLYAKMSIFHERNLKKKCLKGFKQELCQAKEQKLKLQAFHQVHTQKIFFSEWKKSLDLLRLQNIQEERPLIKKANQYHRINLLMKSLKALKAHKIQSKKEKNIKEQVTKMKSKIKGMISEKTEFNIEQFL